MEVKQHPIRWRCRSIRVVSSRWTHNNITSIVSYDMNLVLRSRVHSTLGWHSCFCLSLGCVIVSLKRILIVLMLLLSRGMHVCIWWLSYDTSLLQLMILIGRDLTGRYPKPRLCTTCSSSPCYLRAPHSIFVPCARVIGCSGSHVCCVVSWGDCGSCTEMLLGLVHHMMLLELIIHRWNDLCNKKTIK